MRTWPFMVQYGLVETTSPCVSARLATPPFAEHLELAADGAIVTAEESPRPICLVLSPAEP